MTRPAGALLVAGGFFTAIYYALRSGSGPAWLGEALYAVPPVLAAVLLLRRGDRETGRAAWFWNLLGFGAGLWAAAQLLWTVAAYRGQDPWADPWFRADFGLPIPLNALFIGFLAPIIGAVALRPHARAERSDVVLADTSLLVVAISFAFARLVLVPRAQPLGTQETLLAGLSYLLAISGAALWRRVIDPAWKRAYGFTSLFALAYGCLAAVANGAGGPVPAPGGVLDLAWIVPFFLLAAAALAPAPEAPTVVPADWLVVLLAGPGPLAFDVFLDLLVPLARGSGHASHVPLLLSASALLAFGCVLRLRLQDAAETRALAEARARAEEGDRAGKLGTLASMSASIIEELQHSMSEVVSRASAAAGRIGDQGSRVLGQAQRAEAIVRDLASALSLVRTGSRRELDLGTLLQETIQGAMDTGLGLQVSLEGVADLPPVVGDPGALRAAVLHLVRNASQASPGGTLRISGESTEDEVVLRFADDGPGVPDEARQRIFDPFFTTRRVGEGVGLGLTFVHFVARDHGGAILLEPGGSGSCFALHLPAVARRPEVHGTPQWPLAIAVVASAAMATTLAVLSETHRPGVVGVFEVASALAAAGALAWVAARRKNPARLFWSLLACAPGVWGTARLHRFLTDVSDGPLGTGSVWPLILDALADLSWVAALLVRPDRRQDGPSRRLALLAAGAALCLVAHYYVYLVVLPLPFALLDQALRHDLVVARGALRTVLTLWLAVLALRGHSPYWRGVFGRLALVFACWTAGHTLAGYALSRPDYRAGVLSDMGWIVPFLLLAALGAGEALGERRRSAHAAPVLAPPQPWWTAASLAALATVPVFDALLGSSSTHHALAVARVDVTRATVFLVGVILAVREVLAQRQAAATRVLLHGARSQLVTAERRSRLLGVVGSAVHELGGHLSGIRALVRLLLTQTDISDRARADATRIQANSEAATRIVRNLLGMIRRAPEALTLVSVNDIAREVVEMRAADLAQEGIHLRASLARPIPTVPLDAPAIQQVLLGLIDNAAVAIRSQGRDGYVEVATSVEGDHVVLRVRDNGPGLSAAARRRLAGPLFGGDTPWTGPGLGLHVAREVVSQHAGTIASRNRVQGGAEFEIRLPLHVAAESQTAT